MFRRTGRNSQINPSAFLDTISDTVKAAQNILKNETITKNLETIKQSMDPNNFNEKDLKTLKTYLISIKTNLEQSEEITGKNELITSIDGIIKNIETFKLPQVSKSKTLDKDKQVPLPEIIKKEIRNKNKSIYGRQTLNIENKINMATENNIKKINNSEYHVYGKENEKLIESKIFRATMSADIQKKSEKDSEFFRVNNGNIDKEIVKENESGIGLASSIGRRPTMEDAHLVETFVVHIDGKEKHVKLSAVFDGHGGDECAKYASENLVECLKNRLEDPDLTTFDALKLALVDVSRKFGNQDEKNQSGATANVCMVIDNDLWVANVGDSRSLLVTPYETVQLSEDQKPEMEKYESSIKKREGKVVYDQRGTPRVTDKKMERGIAPARALGDHFLSGVLSARPTITRYTLPEDRTGFYLIQCCDGVFDVASSRQVGDLVRKKTEESLPPEEIANTIVASAYASGSTDNLSAMVSPL